MTERSGEGTASLEKALDVLDAVGRSRDGLGQAELTALLGLPRTTLYRMLGTLVQRGLLRRDPLRRVYCLGMRCFEYARAAYAMPDLAAAAGVELRALRDMTGETSYLSGLDGMEVVVLDRCEGAHRLRSSSSIGQRKPLHATSQGKAILAALPPERRDALVHDIALKPLTRSTITDRRRLQAELRSTAARGWSIDDEEMVDNVRCCGAPIIDASGEVRGAISVAGPAFRLTMERLELIGPEVADAARRIGAQLSASHPTRTDGETRVVDGGWAFQGIAPLWAPAVDGLYWVDTLAPSIHLCADGGDRVIAQLDEPVSAALPHARGIAVQLGERWRLVHQDGSVHALEGPPCQRLSAACVHPDGHVWACVADGERWRVAEFPPDGRGQRGWTLDEPATALAWNADADTLHIAAAGSGTLYSASPYSQGLRRIATVPKGSGKVSGIALDCNGGIWAAMRGGWSVVRFEADGNLDRVVALPVPSPTGVGFGGPRLDTLFITTAREPLGREALEAAPLSGRLFTLAGVARGVPPVPVRERGASGAG